MNIQILEAVSTKIEEQSGLLIMATSTFPVLQLRMMQNLEWRTLEERRLVLKVTSYAV